MANFVNKYGRVTSKSAKKIIAFLRWQIGKEFLCGKKVNTLSCIWYDPKVYEVFAMNTKGVIFLPRFLKYRHSLKSKWVGLAEAMRIEGFGSETPINQKVVTLFFELEKQSTKRHIPNIITYGNTKHRVKI